MTREECENKILEKMKEIKTFMLSIIKMASI